VLNVTKKQAIGLYGSASKLARALEYTRSAVSQWDDEEIPESVYLKLRYQLKPECFDADGRFLGPAPEQRAA
jgi:hypothetical protein